MFRRTPFSFHCHSFHTPGVTAGGDGKGRSTSKEPGLIRVKRCYLKCYIHPLNHFVTTSVMRRNLKLKNMIGNYSTTVQKKIETEDDRAPLILWHEISIWYSWSSLHKCSTQRPNKLWMAWDRRTRLRTKRLLLWQSAMRWSSLLVFLSFK